MIELFLIGLLMGFVGGLGFAMAFIVDPRAKRAREQAARDLGQAVGEIARREGWH